MTKFFRKYNKVLLVCFGVFLMIAFVVPQAIQEFGQGGPDTAVMRLDGRRISYAATTRAASQVQTVERFTRGLLPANSGIDPHGDHWLMAREFARSAGWIGGPSAGAPLSRDIAAAVVEQEYARQFGPQMAQFARQMALSTDEGRKKIEAYTGTLTQEALAGGPSVGEALAAARGIAQMRLEYQRAPRLSEQRLLRDARKQFDLAEVSVVFVGVANKLSTGLPAREEAALIEHFERYKDQRTAKGNPFGYMLPDRVKLEWLVLDRSAAEKAVKVDPIEVQKRIVAGASAEVAEPAKRRAAVEAAIRKELADKVMDEASVAVKSEILRAVSRLSEDGAFKALPADWTQTMPRMAAIARAIPERVLATTGAAVPEPNVFVREGQWLSLETDVAQLPGIAQANMRVSGRDAPLASIVAVTRELLADPQQPLPIHPQVGVPMADPLTDAMGNRYFLTVLAAAKASAPASLDEVRERVVADKKKADAYETLKGGLSAFQLIATDQGLDALAEQFKALSGDVVEVKQAVKVRRSGGVQPPELDVNAKEFVEAVMNAAAGIDATQPLESASKEDLFVAVAIPGSLGVAVAQITEFTPVTREEFRRFADGLQQQLAQQDLVAMPDDPFTQARLEKRLKVERLGHFAQPEEAAEKDKPKAAEGEKPAAK